MKTLFLATAGLLASFGATAQARPTVEEKAIRTTVQQITQNWVNHKFSDMATYTTPDVSWVNIVGMWWQGRSEVQQAHQQIFDAMFKGVSFTPREPTIRLVTPEVAVVNMYCGVGAFYPPDGVNRGNNKEGDNQDLLTLVMVKRNGRWLLTAGQNTVVRADAAPNNPVRTAAK